MLNKKIYALLGFAVISFAPLSFASIAHPDSSQLFAANKGNPPDLTDQVDCCYRQRVTLGTTQGTCPRGSYVVYAEARTRPFKAPAIIYRCETVQVFCKYETAKQCIKDRANA